MELDVESLERRLIFTVSRRITLSLSLKYVSMYVGVYTNKFIYIYLCKKNPYSLAQCIKTPFSLYCVIQGFLDIKKKISDQWKISLYVIHKSNFWPKTRNISLTRIQNLSLMTKFKCPNVERSMARIHIELKRNEIRERGRDPESLSHGLIWSSGFETSIGEYA